MSFIIQRPPESTPTYTLVSYSTRCLAVRLDKRFPTLSRLTMTVFGAIALATLAWTGHGAIDEGNRRYMHFASDIFHLLAAGGWMGALAAFALLLRTKILNGEQEVRILSRVQIGRAHV